MTGNIKQPCRVWGCQRDAHGFGVMCDAHRQNDRNNGHPQQRAISAARDVRPYCALVEERMDKMPDNPVWGVIERRWKALVDHSEATVQRFEYGTPTNKHEVEVARQILKLEREQGWRKVAVTAAAVVILRQLRPANFESDRAFLFQLQRVVRGLGDTSQGTFNGRRKYRYFAPRTAEMLGQWLVEAFGALGMRIAQLEVEKAAAAEQERDAFAAGLEALR